MIPDAKVPLPIHTSLHHKGKIIKPHQNSIKFNSISENGSKTDLIVRSMTSSQMCLEQQGPSPQFQNRLLFSRTFYLRKKMKSKLLQGNPKNKSMDIAHNPEKKKLSKLKTYLYGNVFEASSNLSIISSSLLEVGKLNSQDKIKNSPRKKIQSQNHTHRRPYFVPF